MRILIFILFPFFVAAQVSTTTLLSDFDTEWTRAESFYDARFNVDANGLVIGESASVKWNWGPRYFDWKIFDGLVYAFQVSGDLKYLNDWADMIELLKGIGDASVDNIYNDSYVDWPSCYDCTGTPTATEVSLDDLNGADGIFKMLWILKKYPAIRSTAYGQDGFTTYQDMYDDYLAYFQSNIYEKWKSRGCNQLYRIATYMTSHAIKVIHWLYYIEDNATKKAEYLDYLNAWNGDGTDLETECVSQHYAPGDHFNSHLREVSDRWNWSGVWNNDTGTVDLSHANDDVELVVDMYLNQGSVTQSAMDRMVATMNYIVSNSTSDLATMPFFIDGSGSESQRVAPGWARLGMFDESLQSTLTSAARTFHQSEYQLNTFLGILAYNRAYRDGTLTYADFFTTSSGDCSGCQPVSKWEADFDANWKLAFDEYDWYVTRSTSADASDLYCLGEGIDAATQMWQATGEVQYFVDAKTLIDNAIGTAVLSSSLADSQYQDSYMAWADVTGTSSCITGVNNGEEQILYESKFMRHTAKHLWVLKESPSFRAANPVYDTWYTTTLTWVKTNIWEKWNTRRPLSGLNVLEGSGIDSGANWAMMGFYLGLIEGGTNEYTDIYDYFNTDRNATASGTGGFRQEIETNTANSSAYQWPELWGNAAVSDVDHANRSAAVMIHAFEQQGSDSYWTQGDINSLIEVWDVIWPSGDGDDLYEFMDGSTPLAYELVETGFQKLGRFSETLHLRFEDRNLQYLGGSGEDKVLSLNNSNMAYARAKFANTLFYPETTSLSIKRIRRTIDMRFFAD